MTDPTAEFFDALAARGHEPLLQKAAGSARFEIVDGSKTDRWHLSIDKGAVTVSRRNVSAGCTLRAQKTLFDRIVTGRESVVAAVLRGEVAVEGDWRFLVLLQRIFPGPPGSRRRRPARSTRSG